MASGTSEIALGVPLSSSGTCRLLGTPSRVGSRSSGPPLGAGAAQFGTVTVPPSAGPRGVGSKRTQPMPVKYSSGHACASLAVTTYSPWSFFVPAGEARRPRAAGMPIERDISAIVAANCSQ